MFQDFLHDIVMEEQSSVGDYVFANVGGTYTQGQVAYTDCSTTNGALSLEPYVLRLNNLTDGHIYGNAGAYHFF